MRHPALGYGHLCFIMFCPLMRHSASRCCVTARHLQALRYDFMLNLLISYDSVWFCCTVRAEYLKRLLSGAYCMPLKVFLGLAFCEDAVPVYILKGSYSVTAEKQGNRRSNLFETSPHGK